MTKSVQVRRFAVRPFIAGALTAACMALGAPLAAVAAEPQPLKPTPLPAPGAHADAGIVFAGFLRAPAFQGLVLVDRAGTFHELRTSTIPGAAGFIGALPPGDYKVAGYHKDARDQYTGTGIKFYSSASAPFEGYPLLRVERGRLTELGTWVDVAVGVEVTLLPMHPAERAGAVPAVLAALGDAVTQQQPLTWQVDVPPAAASGIGNLYVDPKADDLVKPLIEDYHRRTGQPGLLGQMARARTQSVAEWYRIAGNAQAITREEPFVAADGTAWYGANLGRLRARSPEGAWRVVDTGAVVPVMAAYVDGSALLAGLDDGRLLRSADGGATWQAAGSVEAGLKPVAISKLGDRWLVTALHPAKDVMTGNPNSADALVVYSARRADLGDLTLLHRLPVNKPGNLKINPVVQGERYLVLASPDLWEYNAGKDAWRQIELPGDVNDFRVDAKTGMIAAYKVAGMFSRLYISSEGGAAPWKRVDQPSIQIHQIRFTDPTHGQALRFQQNATEAHIELHHYDVAQDAWVRDEDAPKGCVRPLSGPPGTPWLCVNKYGTVFARRDSGWLVEATLN